MPSKSSYFTSIFGLIICLQIFDILNSYLKKLKLRINKFGVFFSVVGIFIPLT